MFRSVVEGLRKLTDAIRDLVVEARGIRASIDANTAEAAELKDSVRDAGFAIEQAAVAIEKLAEPEPDPIPTSASWRAGTVVPE